jgi:hypothetical protein
VLNGPRFKWAIFYGWSSKIPLLVSSSKYLSRRACDDELEETINRVGPRNRIAEQGQFKRQSD